MSELEPRQQEMEPHPHLRCFPANKNPGRLQMSRGRRPRPEDVVEKQRFFTPSAEPSLFQGSYICHPANIWISSISTRASAPFTSSFQFLTGSQSDASKASYGPTRL